MLPEFELILREAYKSVEDELALEDAGWIKLGTSTGQNVLTDNERKSAVQRSRIYAMKDPLARQAIRLWTDYTFGTGINWNSEDEKVAEVLSKFWDARVNRNVLSGRGQRKCSDKLLIDGEVFFAIFLGEETAIRTIDPLEITEIISDPEDVENVRFYKRDWTTPQLVGKLDYYRSANNLEGEAVKNSYNQEVSPTQDAVVYHLTFNTIGQRGNPLLLSVLDWIKLYRQFLASRVAVMLALARFAWKAKVTGGQTTVDAIKGVLHEKKPDAASVLVENLGVDTQPIRTDSNARNAYDDGRMLKLQIAAGTGWPEQYFGDISIGNLATAKTVELPVMKMCQSYQAIWKGVYNELDELILEKAGISEDKRHVDRDFPAITPENAGEIAQAIVSILTVLPNLGDSADVQQQALMAMGVLDTNEALAELQKESKTNHGIDAVRAAKALRELQEAIRGDGHR